MIRMPAAESLQNDAAATGRSIACMEVWGGSRVFDASVCVPGNDVEVSCTPFEGGRDGGDIYYVSNCASGLITRFVLADVSGHGEAVARIALDLRRIMRRHINTANQTRFAVELNSAFAGLELGGRFATAVLATYFAPTDHLIVCNAGHPRPLLYRAGKDTWELLDASTPGVLASRESSGTPVGIANLPLGVLNPTDYEQFALHLQPGDIVVLYTDALIEASRPDSPAAQLGERGLVELARGLSAAERTGVARALHDRVIAFAGGRPLGDDATLVALHHNAGDPPTLSWLDQIGKVARMLGLGSIESGPNEES
jgi:serine phosphatase RsbU (regulator of sigma subunit)